MANNITPAGNRLLIMAHPYLRYTSLTEYKAIEKAINELLKNKDLRLNTASEYVVGYLSKAVVEAKPKITLKNLVLEFAQYSMLGAVTTYLRAVTISCSEELLILRAYFDEGATEDDKNLIDEVSTEIMSHLWQNIMHCRYEPVDSAFPTKLEKLQDWIYMRHENPGIQ